MTFNDPSQYEIQALLESMVGRQIAVVGDTMLDAYLMGHISRISPEAPVPVFEIDREEQTLGGAANVAKCLMALGAQVELFGVVGDDAEGRIVLGEATGLKIGTGGMIVDRSRPTTVKRRVVAQRQQMIRLDRESTCPLETEIERELVGRIFQMIKSVDGVVLSDYSKGVLSRAVCAAAIACGKPVVVDPKGTSWDRFTGATVFKPNVRDVRMFKGEQINDDESAARVSAEIVKLLNVRHVMITRGEHGMTLASESADTGRNVMQFRSRPRQVVDVVGAGDVVASTLALALAAGANAPTAAWLANVAAGVKVEKFGTAAVFPQEIVEALGQGLTHFERKIMTAEQAADFTARLRKGGKKVVFTNGCFDILHYGHVSYLDKSRRLGDALVVGVNSDASIRGLKGPGRPVQSEHDRARIMASQAGVDAVVIFDEPTPIDLIRKVRPDVLCKGEDYKEKTNVVGWQEVESWGGRVVLVPLEQGRSTTHIIAKSKQ